MGSAGRWELLSKLLCMGTVVSGGELRRRLPVATINGSSEIWVSQHRRCSYPLVIGASEVGVLYLGWRT